MPSFAGGGQAMPPYLQGRTPMAGGTKPMITPKSMVAPGETKPTGLPGGPTPQLGAMARAGLTNKAMTAAPGSTPAPAQTLYEYFKGDLDRQKKLAGSTLIDDANKRGVYYGSGLTTSQGDLESDYGHALSGLQANILQNEQGNELQRQQMAVSLLSGTPQAQGGGIDPSVFQTIGSLFAPRPGPTAPGITPKPGAVTKPIDKNMFSGK